MTCSPRSPCVAPAVNGISLMTSTSPSRCADAQRMHADSVVVQHRNDAVHGERLSQRSSTCCLRCACACILSDEQRTAACQCRCRQTSPPPSPTDTSIQDQQQRSYPAVITSHRDYHQLSPSSLPSSPVCSPSASNVMSRSGEDCAAPCSCMPSSDSISIMDRSFPSRRTSSIRYANAPGLSPPRPQPSSSSTPSSRARYLTLDSQPPNNNLNGHGHRPVTNVPRLNGNVVHPDHRRVESHNNNHSNSLMNNHHRESDRERLTMSGDSAAGLFHHYHHHHHHHHHLTVMNGTLVSKVLSAPSNAVTSPLAPTSPLSSARLSRRSAPDLSVSRRRTIASLQQPPSFSHSHSNFHPIPPPSLPSLTAKSQPAFATRTCCTAASSAAAASNSALNTGTSFPHVTTRTSGFPSLSSSSSVTFSSSRRRPRHTVAQIQPRSTGSLPSPFPPPLCSSTSGGSGTVCSGCLAKHFQSTGGGREEVIRNSDNSASQVGGDATLSSGVYSDGVSDSDLDSEADSDTNSDLHYNIDLQHPASSSSSSSPLPPPSVGRSGHSIADYHDRTFAQDCPISRRCCYTSESQPHLSLAPSALHPGPSVPGSRHAYHSTNYNPQSNSDSSCRYRQSRQFSCVAPPLADDDPESRLAHLHLASSDALISAHKCFAMLAGSYVHSPPTPPLTRPPHVPRLSGLPTWADDADQLRDAAMDDLHRASAAAAHSTLIASQLPRSQQQQQHPPPPLRPEVSRAPRGCGNEDHYDNSVQYRSHPQSGPGYQSTQSREEDLMYADAECDNHLQCQHDRENSLSHQSNQVVGVPISRVQVNVRRCGDVVVDDEIEEEYGEDHPPIETEFEEDDDDDEDDEDDVDEDDESVRPASPLNYFIHNGLKYDGDVYQLRPPQERSIASRPERVLEHKPPTLANRQVFNRVYSEGTFNARPSSLRQPDTPVDESPPNCASRYVTDDTPVPLRPVTRPPSVRPSAPVIIPPNVSTQLSLVSPDVCSSDSVPASPSLNCDSESNLAATTNTANAPINAEAGRIGAVNGSGVQGFTGNGDAGSGGSQLFYKHGFAGTPPQQAQAVLHTLSGDENGVPFVRPRGRSYGAFASGGSNASLPSSLPRPRPSKPPCQQLSPSAPPSTSCTDPSRSGRLPSSTHRRSSLWKLLSR